MMLGNMFGETVLIQYVNLGWNDSETKFSTCFGCI